MVSALVGRALLLLPSATLHPRARRVPRQAIPLTPLTPLILLILLTLLILPTLIVAHPLLLIVALPLLLIVAHPLHQPTLIYQLFQRSLILADTLLTLEICLGLPLLEVPRPTLPFPLFKAEQAMASHSTLTMELHSWSAETTWPRTELKLKERLSSWEILVSSPVVSTRLVSMVYHTNMDMDRMC